jgi:hypothetical protein
MANETNSTITNMTYLDGFDPVDVIIDNVSALTTPVVPSMMRPPEGRPRFRHQPPEFMRLLKLYDIVNTYVTLTIIVIGLVMNIVLIYAMKTSRLKNMAYTVIVCSLSGSDCGYLIVQFINWLSNVFKINATAHPGMCQLFTFVEFCFSFLPLWYLLGLLAERCRALTIIYMRKPPTVKFRVRLYIFLITSLCVLIYSICLWAYGVREYKRGPFVIKFCTPRSRYVTIWKPFVKTDLVFSLVFPLTGILIVFSFDLMYFVVNHTRTRTIRDARDRNHSVAQAYRDEKWFTISVLVAVAVHIILIIPGTKAKFINFNPPLIPDQLEGIRGRLMEIICHTAHAVKPFAFFAINPGLRKKVSRWFQPLKKLLFRGRFVHNPQRIPTNLC